MVPPMLGGTPSKTGDEDARAGWTPEAFELDHRLGVLGGDWDVAPFAKSP